MSLYVFNQYYFDLLKKIKANASESTSEGLFQFSIPMKKTIKKAIKENYRSYDKLSCEYRDYFVESTKDVRESLAVAIADIVTIDQAKAWLDNDTTNNVEIYKGISVGSIVSMLHSSKSFLYYFSLLCIFGGDHNINEEDVAKIVGLLKSIKNNEKFTADLATLQLSVENPEVIQNHLKLLLLLQTSTTKQPTGDAVPPPDNMSETMKALESTSLGKLAKEIMEEVNVADISESIDGDPANIFKFLSNPDGGVSKLMGTVSQKMLSKMASGELNQETLFKDAMEFSSHIQGMMPSGGAKGSGFPDIGDMMSKVGQFASMMGNNGGGDDSDDEGGGGAGGFDMTKLASMMGAMMGGGGGAKKKDSRATFNAPAMSRAAKAKQLRRKLESRKRANANAPEKSE